MSPQQSRQGPERPTLAPVGRWLWHHAFALAGCVVCAVLHWRFGYAASLPTSVGLLLARSPRARRVAHTVPFLLPALLIVWVFSLARPLRDAGASPTGQQVVGYMWGLVPWEYLRAVGLVLVGLAFLSVVRRRSRGGGRR